MSKISVKDINWDELDNIQANRSKLRDSDHVIVLSSETKKPYRSTLSYLFNGELGKVSRRVDNIGRSLSISSNRFSQAERELNSNLDTLNEEMLGKLDDAPGEIKETNIGDNEISVGKLKVNNIFANQAVIETMVSEQTFTDELIANTAFIDELFAKNIVITGSITNGNSDFSVDPDGFSVQKNSASGFFPERSYSVKDGDTVLGAIYADSGGRIIFRARNNNDMYIGPFSSGNNLWVSNGTLVLPRHSEYVRDNGLNPQLGSMIWNSDVNKAEVWDGSMWRDATQNTVT